MNVDLGLQAQHAAETHLNECWEALDAENEGAVGVQWPDMAGPFCGCQTCEVREVLHAAWPILRDGARLREGLTS